VPSRSTVWRILNRHGLIVAAPHKRPKSATKRFCFSRPNECAVTTGPFLAAGRWHRGAIAGSLDDHSRYVPALQAGFGHAHRRVWCGR